jgi:hypothetical protein
MDTESVRCVPDCARMLFSPATHEPARRRNYIATPPLPCTLEPSPALAVTRFRRTLTEPDQFATGIVSHSRSLVHHWTETTTPSPARRPNPPIVSIEVHPRPRPSRADKAPAPLSLPVPLAICSHSLPSPLWEIPSCSPRSHPSCQASASSPKDSPKSRKKGEGCCHTRGCWPLSSPSLASQTLCDANATLFQG